MQTCHTTAPGLSFSTADDLSALRLAIDDAEQSLQEALRRRDRLADAHDLAEGEHLDLDAVRRALGGLPAVLGAIGRPLTPLFSAAESVEDVGNAVVALDTMDDIPF